MTRILIVDDHEVVRRGLKQILIEELPKAHISEAEDSPSALQCLTNEVFDLVLLDINIPGRSGLDLLEEIKRLQAKTPVLVLSASPEEDFALRCLKLGAAGYITKRSASDELVLAVRKALTGGKYVTASIAEKLVHSMSGEAVQEPHETLSNRELQVLRMIAEGKTLKEIASELSLSEKTISTYRSRISEKMRLASNVEITRYAIQHGLAG
jgi:two-component system, NarL family, invasion response regulator UvrY